MSTDLKTDFYFRHRALIEEWAALREPARTSFDTALRALASRMALTAGEVEEMPVDAQGGWSKVRVSRPLWVHSGWRLSIALGWNTGHLLKLGSNGRPYVGVALDDTTSDQRRRSKAVNSRCSAVARDLGWREARQDAWPVWGWVEQPAEDASLDAWVEECAASFELGWSALNELLDQVADGCI